MVGLDFATYILGICLYFPVLNNSGGRFTFPISSTKMMVQMALGEKTRTILPGVPVTGAGATITRIGPRIMINPIKPGKFPGAKVPHHNPSAWKNGPCLLRWCMPNSDSENIENTVPVIVRHPMAVARSSTSLLPWSQRRWMDCCCFFPLNGSYVNWYQSRVNWCVNLF